MKQNHILQQLGTYVCVGLLIALAFTACSSSSEPKSTDGTLKVVIDNTTCTGDISNVSVSIDGEYAGMLQPGQSVSKTKPEGNHIVTAKSAEGATWGPLTVPVSAGATFTETLTCSNTSSTGDLYVYIDANCVGQGGEVRVYVDGTYIGSAFAGGAGVTKTLPTGTHYISAASADGNLTWSSAPVSLGSNGTRYRLYC